MLAVSQNLKPLALMEEIFNLRMFSVEVKERKVEGGDGENGEVA